MRDENWRMAASSFHQQEWRNPRRRGILQQDSQSCDGRRCVDHHRRKIAAESAGDLFKQLGGKRRSAAQIEKIVACTDGWALQYALPDGRQNLYRDRKSVV